VNPEPFQNLDRLIHEKGRMAIMAWLAASPGQSFTELRDALKMTDGNLITHLRTLQEAGYVAVTKTFEGGKPLSTYALTAKGRKAFEEYIALLEEIVRQSRSP
jgi:DNA-binding MarR family transcriptional regulator